MNFISNDTPSMNNIYDSDFYNKTKQYEQKLANKKFNDSKNPFKTGVVPRPAYSSMFMDSVDYNEDPNYIKSLSGNNIDVNNFKHGNMQHFLTKGITQNVNLDNNSKFNKNFGYNEFNTKKAEVENFFEPTANTSCINGSQNNVNFLLSRTSVTEKQNNYNPIQSIRVAPGLNKGYTSIGSGGFQQADSLLYSKPKQKEELRPISNQKTSIFEMPIQATKQGTEQRGVVNPFNKNRPETTYKQDENNWFKGQSVIKKDSNRPEENIKDTTRISSHINYYGPVKDQTLQINDTDDYGKSSILVYDTEKHQISTQETRVANLSSVIKAITAPITDALKISLKEYFIDNPRINGNAVPQAPEKQTTYDPATHILKTTVKETTIHDGNGGVLTGADETYSALYDTAKTTTKETTIHDGNGGVLTGEDGTYSALYDTAKTTTKETTIHDGNGGVLTGEDGTYSALYDTTKTTTKETTIHDGNGGVLTGEDGTYSALYDTTKTTTKETTIHDGNGGVLTGEDGTYSALYDTTKTTTKETTIHDGNGGVLTGEDGTYSALYDTTKTTTKETTIHDGNGGVLTGADETYSALYDNAKTTTKETTIHDGNGGFIKTRELSYVRSKDAAKTTTKETLPQQDNVRNINNVRYKSTYVYDPSIVAKTTVKETTINTGSSQFGFIGGFLNSLIGGYIIKDENAKNTQRQFSHPENYGIAGSKSSFVPTDREAELNAEIDGTREIIMMKAGYTPNGAGNFSSTPKENINMSVKKQIDMQECSEPIRNIGKIYQTRPMAINEDNITKTAYKPNAFNDRLDSSILSTLVNNDNVIKINPIRTDCKAI